jgi:hypothetical protein
MLIQTISTDRRALDRRENFSRNIFMEARMIINGMESKNGSQSISYTAPTTGYLYTSKKVEKAAKISVKPLSRSKMRPVPELPGAGLFVIAKVNKLTEHLIKKTFSLQLAQYQHFA